MPIWRDFPHCAYVFFCLLTIITSPYQSIAWTPAPHTPHSPATHADHSQLIWSMPRPHQLTTVTMTNSNHRNTMTTQCWPQPQPPQCDNADNNSTTNTTPTTQIVQSQTLAKVGHPTCTFTCKGGTSWCQPKECKTRSGRSTENFIEACKASTGWWMLPL